jgi:hypothetical protein
MNNVQYENKKNADFFHDFYLLNHIIIMNNVQFESKKKLQITYDC